MFSIKTGVIENWKRKYFDRKSEIFHLEML